MITELLQPLFSSKNHHWNTFTTAGTPSFAVRKMKLLRLTLLVFAWELCRAQNFPPSFSSAVSSVNIEELPGEDPGDILYSCDP